jgi:hypothetical protein
MSIINSARSVKFVVAPGPLSPDLHKNDVECVFDRAQIESLSRIEGVIGD